PAWPVARGADSATRLVAVSRSRTPTGRFSRRGRELASEKETASESAGRRGRGAGTRGTTPLTAHAGGRPKAQASSAFRDAGARSVPPPPTGPRGSAFE